jgi:hypothetical protein
VFVAIVISAMNYDYSFLCRNLEIFKTRIFPVSSSIVPIHPAARKKGCDLVVVIHLFFLRLTWDLACLFDFEFNFLQKKYIILETEQISLS